MADRNTTLTAWRVSHRLSQDELARELGTATRNIQRWESGRTRRLHSAHARALEKLTGLTVQQLGFPADVDVLVVEDGRGGHDLAMRPPEADTNAAGEPGNFSGVWLSRYDYFSSGRDQWFANHHHVVLIHEGNRIDVASLGRPAKSAVSMRLEADGTVISGHWEELTEQDGYYRGARYFGVIHMLAEPTGRRLTGKWLGFGREMEVNSGPWQLTLLDPSTSKTTITKYDRPPQAA